MPDCRSCAAPILWTEMRESRKRHPVDVTPVELATPSVMLGLVALPEGAHERAFVVSQYTTVGELRGCKLHSSHFATCPNAAMHRRVNADAQGTLA